MSIKKDINYAEKTLGFSTPVEDRSYRDALDAIEKAKTESSRPSLYKHTPEKYADYIFEKKLKQQAPEVAKKWGIDTNSTELDKNKQFPVPLSGVYVGSFARKKCRLAGISDNDGFRIANKCILRVGSTFNALKEDIGSLKNKDVSHEEKNYINKYNRAVKELKKYQTPMTVNSREDFIKLAKEIADKLHQFNKQGL